MRAIIIIGSVLLLAAMGSTLPTTLLEDTKDAQLRGTTSKQAASPGQEGGLQAPQTPSASKMISKFHETPYSAYQGDGKTVAQYEKGYQYGVGKAAMDKHVENALLKSELYGEPASVNQYRYYGEGDERLYATPTKRSGPSFRAARLKRELTLDPEDVLALLSLWEAERRHPAPSAAIWPRYQVEEPEEEEEDEEQEGAWLDGPVYPAPASMDHRNLYYPAQMGPAFQYPMQKREGQWGGFIKDKRFMVSRKRQVGPPRGGVHSLAQLLNSTPHREGGLPLYRRVVL